MVCVNLGYSSIYAFLPLYAQASGLDGNLGWFYVLFSICIITGRLTLAGPPRLPALAAAAIMLGGSAMGRSTRAVCWAPCWSGSRWSGCPSRPASAWRRRARLPG
jgi:hypothetical protein